MIYCIYSYFSKYNSQVLLMRYKYIYLGPIRATLNLDSMHVGTGPMNGYNLD